MTHAAHHRATVPRPAADAAGIRLSCGVITAGVAELALHDPNTAGMEGLAGRLAQHYPALRLVLGHKDPAGFDVVVNATPLGMQPGDPLPMDPARIDPATFVGEVVLKTEITPLLAAARARGCRIQVGTDMLFEQIPAYLEFFGFPRPKVAELREVAAIRY